MRVLVAIISYAGDALNGNHDAIRQTWGKDCQAAGVDLRFFVGRRGPYFVPQNDEVLIDWQKTRTCEHPWFSSVENCCEDFWQPLVKNSLRWSFSQNYDFTFQCECDTFLIPRLLMEADFKRYDFSGHLIQGGEKYPWAELGTGYFVSKKAAEILIQTPPSHLSVGIFAGQVLGPFIEKGVLTSVSLRSFWQKVSWHFRTETGDGYPAGSPWMKEMYEKHK
jgi:hypothetical protein